jgi:hypothetical protein
MSVDRTEFAVFICPFVPDSNAMILEILDIGITSYEPEEFIND